MILPKSIQKLIQLIISYINPESIILFGSRARGDFRQNSDFDIAVKKANLDQHHWADLLVKVDEEPITLLKVDLLHYEDLSDSYKKNIDQEGILIYEQNISR